MSSAYVPLLNEATDAELMMELMKRYQVGFVFITAKVGKVKGRDDCRVEITYGPHMLLASGLLAEGKKLFDALNQATPVVNPTEG